MDANGDHTAGYSFRLLDLASATAITPGTPINAMLSPGNETHMMQFNAVEGDAFYVDSLNVSGIPNAYWRIIGPYNDVVAFRRLDSDEDTFRVPATGIYTLLVEGRIH